MVDPGPRPTRCNASRGRSECMFSMARMKDCSSAAPQPKYHVRGKTCCEYSQAARACVCLCICVGVGQPCRSRTEGREGIACLSAPAFPAQETSCRNGSLSSQLERKYNMAIVNEEKGASKGPLFVAMCAHLWVISASGGRSGRRWCRQHRGDCRADAPRAPRVLT